ncbi:hypothetical protein Q9L58_009102 [Maublancomyces gigas]|uniref:Uncharacterized protein n=1 Tax=Discina gigas TaxID=1032678 RepID=A0ABR3G7T9_9PEZI
MLTSWWKTATTVFRGKKKPDPWRPHHASSCEHSRTAIPQRNSSRPSSNPTINIIPPTPERLPSEFIGSCRPTKPEHPVAKPLPLHPSPFINLTRAHNNQKTASITSISPVNLTFTNSFHHTNTTSNKSPTESPLDELDKLPTSNLYYVYHLAPTADHTFYHYAYYGTWVSVADLPDPRKHQPRWIYNAETKKYVIVDHQLFGLKGDCDCELAEGGSNRRCNNMRVAMAAEWRI